jgi:phosphonate transport system permease protein
VRNGRAAGLLVLLAVLAWSAYGCGVGRGPLVNDGGWPVAQKFLVAALHPERSGEFLSLVGTSTSITIAYAVLGAAMALVVGAVGCIFVSATFWRTASHRSGAVAWAGLRGGLALPRGLHETVWAILLVNVLGLDPLVAILAIGIPYGAVTAKVWADLLDEVPHGPYEALRLAGVRRFSATLYGLLPQARGDLLSYSFYRLECALRSAVLLGIVGAGGLGFQLDLSFQALRYREMWTVLYAVVLLCAVTDAVGTRIRNRLSERVPAPPRPGSNQSRLRHPRHDPVLLGAVVLTTVLLGWAWHYLRVRPATLASERAGQQAALVLGDAWPPRRDGHTLTTLVRLSLETVQMSVVAIALAAAGGALLALLAARARRAGAPRRIAGAAVRLLLLLARAVPPPV